MKALHMPDEAYSGKYSILVVCEETLSKRILTVSMTIILSEKYRHSTCH